MKLSLKTLTILTVFAFLLSPIITIVPGLLLLLSIGFLWVSQSFNIENPAEIIEEEEENKTDIIDKDDRIIIIEKKTIYKKDLTFDDFRKYGLKNTSCVGDCVSFEAAKTKNHYKLKHKHCMVCNKWLVSNEINCPCCSSELRTKEKNVKDVETLL